MSPLSLLTRKRTGSLLVSAPRKGAGEGCMQGHAGFAAPGSACTPQPVKSQGRAFQLLLNP